MMQQSQGNALEGMQRDAPNRVNNRLSAWVYEVVRFFGTTRKGGGGVSLHMYILSSFTPAFGSSVSSKSVKIKNKKNLCSVFGGGRNSCTVKLVDLHRVLASQSGER